MTSISDEQLKGILEAALSAAGRPLSVDRLLGLFSEAEQPSREQILKALETLALEYEGRAIALKETASGFRIQVRAEFAPWVARLWEERPGRYSRALMETLALITYRQPITRAEIEDVRGVSVSTSIINTLQDREWIRVVGHRDVPGKPAMYGTTRQFLDDFGLKSLDDLPTLAELRDIEAISAEFDVQVTQEQAEGSETEDAQIQDVDSAKEDSGAADAPRQVCADPASDVAANEIPDSETLSLDPDASSQGDSL